MGTNIESRPLSRREEGNYKVSKSYRGIDDDDDDDDVIVEMKITSV